VKRQTASMNKKVAVLDTSAFIAGFDPFSISAEQYTVPRVKEEIIENTMSGFRLETAEQSGKLKIKTPSQAFLDKVKASATQVGETYFLSETDHQILALALELKASGYLPLIITDDYSIQNVANRMGIQFASLATFGIRRQWQWIRYCPACHKQYPADTKLRTCEVCGTELKRKPKRKSNLTQNNLQKT